MIPQTRNFFAIIVHYGDVGSTVKAVDSLLSNNVFEHVLVVDHEKKPLTHSWNSQKVTIVRPKRNSGYASGCNLGLGWFGQKAILPDDVVFCMNNDLIFTPQALVDIKDWWSRVSGIHTLASPVLREPSGVVKALSTVSFLTGRANPYRPFRGLNRLTGFSYLHGACVSAPYGTWMHLGGWPSNFGVYWEDVALSRIARMGGIDLQIIPSSPVYHASVPVSNNASGRRIYYLVRNGAWVMSRLSPRGLRWFWRLGNRIRYSWHALRGHRQIQQALADSFSVTLPPFN